MNNSAMFKLSYGLFVLTARENGKDNGCIINTAAQITQNPKRITIAVNKANYTHDMIDATKEFNVSILSVEAPFEIFTHFGFQSGRDTEKILDTESMTRSANGIAYIAQYTNAYISAKVVEQYDFGSHTLFVAEVTDCEILSDAESVTYDYYQKNIKPKPKKTEKKGYRCKVCGYVYEGDELPKDFVCPICKHGADDFEKI